MKLSHTEEKALALFRQLVEIDQAQLIELMEHWLALYRAVGRPPAAISRASAPARSR